MADNFNYDFDTIQAGKKGGKPSKPWRERKKQSSEEEEEDDEVDVQGPEAQKRINAGFTGFGKIQESSGQEEEEEKINDRSNRSGFSKSQMDSSALKDKNFLTEKEKLELEKKNNQLMSDMNVKEEIEGFFTEKEAPKSTLFGKNDVFSRFRH